MKSPSLKDDVVVESVGDEAVIVDLKGNRVISLNKTGARLVMRLAEGASIDEIVTEIAQSFGVEEDRVRADAETLIRELNQHGVLE